MSSHNEAPSKITFPIAIDSSAFGDLTACQAKYYWRHLRGLTDRSIKVDLHFGGVIAHSLDVLRRAFFFDKLPREEALHKMRLAALTKWGDFPEQPLDRRGQPHVKSLPALLDTLESYVEYFGLETDELTPISSEFSFALPIPRTSHPETGEPILWTGRIDMVAKGLGGVWIVDEKSTSRLGPSWADQWMLRPQFIGYAWALHEHGYNPSGVVVRGLGIYKDRVEFKPVVVTVTPHMVELFLDQVVDAIERLKTSYYAGNQVLTVRDVFHHSFGTACSQYGTCQFLPLCRSPDPERWTGDYKYEPWNPLLVEEL